MARKYFGTDGVRGRVGEHPMTVDFALRLASAAARVLAPQGGTVLIGKDTRLSGYMFEAALEAGFVAAGVNVMLIGPLPTPGIAYLTRKFECDFGIVISASHNLYDDNGIKFFDAQGGKLSDEIEEAIEAELERGAITRSSMNLGRAHARRQVAPPLPGLLRRIAAQGHDARGAEARDRLRATARATRWCRARSPISVPRSFRSVARRTAATSMTVAAPPSPGLLQLTVPGVRAAAGIALDGDGDRLVMVDGLGRIIDGDQLIYIIATRAQARRRCSRGPWSGRS